MESNYSSIRLTGWIVLSLLAIVAVASKIALNEERWARYREENQKLQAAVALGHEVKERVRLAWKTEMSMDEFIKVFGPVTELADSPDPKDPPMTHSFRHEASQRTFLLRFESGILKGYNSSHGYDDVNTGVVFESPAFLQSEIIRGRLLQICLIVWLIAFVASVWVRKDRQVSASLFILVFLAVICFSCQLLAPNYSIIWPGFFLRDDLFFVYIMLVVSLAITFCRDQIASGKSRRRLLSRPQ